MANWLLVNIYNRCNPEKLAPWLVPFAFYKKVGKKKTTTAIRLSHTHAWIPFLYQNHKAMISHAKKKKKANTY